MAPRRLRHRGAAAIAVAVALTLALVVAVGPAGADPARPTNFESRLLTPATPLDGVTVEIQGGDAFIALSAAPGHEVVVPDYSADDTDRAYLRFLADGTVQVNDQSAAASANESRFGSSSEDFDPDGAPRWRTVARDGSYAWHDHRIHLMVPDDMAVVDARGRVDLGGDDGTWAVPIRVDGVETVVRGELVRLDGPVSWPWYLMIVATALVSVGHLLVVPRARGWALTVGLLVVAGLAAAVSANELSRAPDGSGASVVPVALATAAACAAVVAAVGRLAGRRSATVVRTGTAGAAATLVWWGATRVDVFAHTILPSGMGGLDRVTTAGALGWGLGAAVVLVWRPALLTTEP